MDEEHDFVQCGCECDQDEACLGVMFKYDDRPRSISTYNGFLSFLVAPFEGCGGSVSASGGAVGWFTIPKPEALTRRPRPRPRTCCAGRKREPRRQVSDPLCSLCEHSRASWVLAIYFARWI